MENSCDPLLHGKGKVAVSIRVERNRSFSAPKGAGAAVSLRVRAITVLRSNGRNLLHRGGRLRPAPLGWLRRPQPHTRRRKLSYDRVHESGGQVTSAMERFCGLSKYIPANQRPKACGGLSACSVPVSSTLLRMKSKSCRCSYMRFAPHTK